jgi:hypothetical protein
LKTALKKGRRSGSAKGKAFATSYLERMGKAFETATMSE